MIARPARRALLRPPLLGLVAGWVDAIGWLQAGTFAGAMSGNTVLLGLSTARRHWHQAQWQALTIATFFGALFVGRLLSREARNPDWTIAGAAILLGFVAISERMPWELLLLAAALALTNAASLRYGDVSVNTSFITGDLTKLADALAERLHPSRKRAQPPETLGAIPVLWLCYAAGALGGGLAQSTLHLPLLPAAILLLVILSIA